MSLTTNRTYDLNRVFHYPTRHGPVLAVAVTAPDASMLLSVYSILVNSAVGQLWAIIIIMGVYAIIRQPIEIRSHNSVVASVGVLNAKKPLDVGTLTVKYLYTLGKKSPWSLLIWLVISVLALVASVVVPALVGRSMILGHGAPVSAQSIYVPFAVNKSEDLAVRLHIMEVPSALRAAGSVRLANLAEQTNDIQIDKQLRWGERHSFDEEYTSQFDYRYQVSALEFGLQKHESLMLYVQGSCITEYGWHNATNTFKLDGESRYNMDTYHLWNDHKSVVNVSSYGAPMPPMGHFFTPRNPPEPDASHRNTSFAIIVSSIGRLSNTEGKDPFYLTRPVDPTNIVRSARPVLSCWQDDTWSYNGQNYSVLNLTSTTSPSNDLPHTLGKTFQHFFLVPKIVTVGIRLGASALHSASAALGPIFDAGHASIESDLRNLVLTSYIATKNTLADTTLFEHDAKSASDLPNLIEEDELEDASGFVIYSKEVSAISVPILIAVPLVVLFMFIIAYLMTTHPWFPWHIVQDYQATILYSLLDEKLSSEGPHDPDDSKETPSNGTHGWKRKSIAWVEGTRTSSRHASIVSRDGGRPSFTMKGRREFKRLDEEPDQRNSDIPLLEINHDVALENEQHGWDQENRCTIKRR